MTVTEAIEELVSDALRQWEPSGDNHSPELRTALRGAYADGFEAAMMRGWEEHQKAKQMHCEHCGAWLVENCATCGAPNCCPQCCRITQLEEVNKKLGITSGSYTLPPHIEAQMVALIRERDRAKTLAEGLAEKVVDEKLHRADLQRTIDAMNLP
jgi:hypothetical protein